MLLQILVLTALIISVTGHGRVIDPPARSTMWRYGYNTPVNYDDHGLNCGGFGRQYSTNGGKCGICGDAYDLAEPRPHELGGKYGLGIIVADFKPGQVFTVAVDLTVHHMGYWTFKICPDPTSNDQSCFDQYTLELEDGGTQYYPSSAGLFRVNYRLPEGLTCEHCVLQWRYTAGNNWGNCGGGISGLGCGNQETFLACSDIRVLLTANAEPLPVEFAK